jgi:DNA invertase Pin-like site-specific DNA recombinase
MSTRRRKSQPTTSTTAVVYCRVSALDSQSESDVSLEQQERTLTALAEAAGYSVVVVRERHTASKSQPELETALAALDAGTYAALYAAKIDRLSRKGAADVLRIADSAERHGWRLVVSDVNLDTGSTVGRLVLTILAGVAEMESRRRSDRMAEYHAGRRNRGELAGHHYGRKNTTSAATAERILGAWLAGQTFSAIARDLDVEQVDGRRWHATTVRRTALAASVVPLAA